MKNDHPTWYAADLSEEQQAALPRLHDNSCILASAGSGKTQTLVYALADAIKSGIVPDQIVAFTFTEKAADELLARVHFLLRRVSGDTNLSGLKIGTIHGWSFQFLQEHSDYYNFDPVDELQLYALVGRLYDEIDLKGAYGKEYPRAIREFLADLDLFYNESLEFDGVPSKIRPSLKKFLSILHKNRLLTFGEMIRATTTALKAAGPLPNLKRLFVDEYQDVNPAQVRLIESMVPPQGAVVVVGDDLQCIYNWRGSDVSQILNFPTKFKAEVSTLTDNYRSREQLVVFGNRVSSNIARRFPKVMKAKRPPAQAPIVLHSTFTTEQEQAKAISTLVRKFKNEGVPYNRIAVLLRSVSSAGGPIVDALAADDIPVECPMLSRGGSFIDEFVMPLFEWLSLERTPAQNEEEETEQIQQTEALWKRLRPWLPASWQAQKFWALLNEWSALITKSDSRSYDVRGRFYDFLDACDIHVSSDDRELMVALGVASQIIRSVEEVQRRRITGVRRKSARNIMRDVFFGLLYNKDSFGESVPIDREADAVVVTTVHQSKGLEWPIVILATLNKNRFPLPKKAHGTSFPDSVAARYGTTEEDEWRLFYVACTRAKERLFLFDFAASNPEKRSPFLKKLSGHMAFMDFNDAAARTEIFRLSDEELKAPDPSPLRMALSDLLMHMECGFQYGLRRIAGIQPSIADDLGYGRSLHELAQRRFNHGRNWNEADLERQVEDNVHLPYVGEKQLQESKAAIKKRIRSLEKAGAFTGHAQPELRVDAVFENGIVHGIVDCVVSDDTSATVRDWKTNIHSDFVPRYERQLQFYVHALQSLGKNVARAEMVNVGATHESGELTIVPVSTLAEAITDNVVRIGETLRNISQRQFAATPSESTCRVCDMRRLCSYRASDE